MNTRNNSRGLKHFPPRGSRGRARVWARAAALFVAASLLLGPLPALAQDDPPDPELQQIEKEKKRIELEAAKIDLATKAREARFPSPTSTPLAGTTETNDATFIEEQIQGHNSVNAAAQQVAGRIQSRLSGARVFVVHNSSSVGMMTTYAAGRKRIDALGRRYDAVIKEMTSALASDPMRQMPRPGVETAAGRSERALSPATAIGAATSVVGSFVDFLSFFRSNVNITGTTFDVANDVFVSSLFDALRARYGQDVSLYHPAAVPPNLMSPPNSAILGELEVLFAKRDEALDLKRQIDERVAKKRKQIADLTKLIEDAQKAIKEYEDEQAEPGGKRGRDDADADAPDPFDTIAPAEGSGALRRARPAGRRQTARKRPAPKPEPKPEPKPDPRPALQARIAEYEALIVALEGDIVRLNEGARHLPGVNTQFENLTKDLLAVDEQSGISLLTGYLLTESLQEVMKQDGSYWLVLNVVKAGGNRKVKTNLIWDVFRGGAKVTHSGGAVVHFNVYDRAGASVLSGLHGRYLKYRSADKIE